jgi:hypothetical protein
VTEPFAIEQVESRIRAAGMEFYNVRLRGPEAEAGDVRRVEFSCAAAPASAALRLAADLKGLPGVREVELS